MNDGDEDGEMTEGLDGVDGRVDPALLRRLILAAADESCTRKQRAMLALHLDGLPTTEIGRRLGVSQQSAHRQLYGERKTEYKGKKYGGAVNNLRKTTLLEEVMKVRNQKPDGVFSQADALWWFSRMLPSQDSLFIPLAVLLVAHLAADSKRSLTIEDLCARVPRRVVTHAIGPLKAGGWIATDGITITIRKTPIEDAP